MGHNRKRVGGETLEQRLWDAMRAGPIQRSQVPELIGVHGKSASNVLYRMVRYGYAERIGPLTYQRTKRSPDDGRGRPVKTQPTPRVFTAPPPRQRVLASPLAQALAWEPFNKVASESASLDNRSPQLRPEEAFSLAGMMKALP